MWLRILLFAIFCSCTSLALSVFSASKEMDKDFREEITISKLLFNNSQDDLYNLHIAKTGGTSFYSDMRKHGIKFKSSEDKNWRRLRHDRDNFSLIFISDHRNLCFWLKMVDSKSRVDLLVFRASVSYNDSRALVPRGFHVQALH